MASRREEVIQAVLALVTAALPGATVKRNDELPMRVPAGGLAIVRDGDPGEPEVLMSPLTYLWDHAIQLELAAPAGAGREAALDDMLTALGAAIEADRTLGGLCDWLEPTAPDTNDATTENSQPVRWALLDLTATYATTSPLG